MTLRQRLKIHLRHNAPSGDPFDLAVCALQFLAELDGRDMVDQAIFIAEAGQAAIARLVDQDEDSIIELLKQAECRRCGSTHLEAGSAGPRAGALPPDVEAALESWRVPGPGLPPAGVEAVQDGPVHLVSEAVLVGPNASSAELPERLTTTIAPEHLEQLREAASNPDRT